MINRREFISAVGAISLAPKSTAAQPALIKPPRVRPGDTVGLVSPATAAWETEPTKIWVDALVVIRSPASIAEEYASIGKRRDGRAETPSLAAENAAEGANAGERVAEARKSRRMRQEDVAQALGVSRPMLAQIEAGRKKPGVELAERIVSWISEG